MQGAGEPLVVQVDAQRSSVGAQGVVQVVHEEVVGVLRCEQVAVAGVGVGAGGEALVIHQGHDRDLPQTAVTENM